MFRDVVKQYEKNSIIVSILMIILSIFLIFMPFDSAVTVIWMFGIFAIVDGIIHLVSYFNTDANNRLANFEFAEGIIDILSGILICICANYLVLFLPIMIGVWIIVKSIAKMQISLNMRNSEESSWIFILILSIITLMQVKSKSAIANVNAFNISNFVSLLQLYFLYGSLSAKKCFVCISSFT